MDFSQWRAWAIVAVLTVMLNVSIVEAGGGSRDVKSYPSLAAAAADVAAELQTGSLLFSQGDCLAIRVYTASSYTHVAIVCVENGEPFIYDSQNGVGVRRLPLADYFAAESPHDLRVFHPHRPLTAEQGRELETFLRSQLGRPYAIHHHVSGMRADGVHCSEYATDALMSVGLIRAQRPSNVSPASLETGITRADIYRTGETISLELPDPPQPPAKNGCHKLWLDTKRCTRDCWDKLSGWVLCR